MKIAFYDTHSYDKESFEKANEKFGYTIDFFDFKLSERTAGAAKGFQAVCVFVNDVVNAEVIRILKEENVKLIILRCAGFNNVDLKAAYDAGMKVLRVPAYSPYAVAEHAVEGLTGRDLHGLTAGVFGTGKIGRIMAELLSGFGMDIILYDPYPDTKWASSKGFRYVDVPSIFRESDVLSFHCPLTEQTRHIVNHDTMKTMKSDAILINTGRGALIDSKALVHALKHNHIGGAALDVYEEESKYFFNDWSANVITDDVLARLMTFPNVLITSHQAFLTNNALANIADVTLGNVKAFENGTELVNEVKPV